MGGSGASSTRSFRTEAVARAIARAVLAALAIARFPVSPVAAKPHAPSWRTRIPTPRDSLREIASTSRFFTLTFSSVRTSARTSP